jgi:hypothetical protein
VAGEDSAKPGFEREAEMKRLTSLSWGLFGIFAMASAVWALAGVFGAEPTGRNTGWIPGIYELANRPNRFGGYFVNAQDVFCYRGDAREFNAFLSQYAKLAGTPLVLYLHVGLKNIRLPWPDQTVKLDPDWTLYVSPKSWSMYRDEPNAPDFITRTDIWLGGKIRREDIKVPENITVR